MFMCMVSYCRRRYGIKTNPKMVLVREFLWGFSVISFVFRGLGKTFCMAVSLTSTPPPPQPQPPPCSSSSSSSPSSWLVWALLKKGVSFATNNNKAKNQLLGSKEDNALTREDVKGVGNDHHEQVIKGTSRSRKRPAKLVVPECCPGLEFGEMDKTREIKEFEVEGRDYCLASKKGRREVMEDGYGVLLDISGDSKQAFFTVIDGHGGRAATDYVAENLGKNILKAFELVGKEEEQLEAAIHEGYLATDVEFLSQGVNGGACAASVFIRNGDLHVANLGDCRAVLSRKGVAQVLTRDHRLSREDERFRIESSGGYVHCRSGVWRVNGTLAVSRAIGDLHLKEWIISAPEINKFPLTSDCEFLIIASDGLWDKVNYQEAVDVVANGKSSIESCKELVHMSCRRGNMDDVTVMVINVQQFVANSG